MRTTLIAVVLCVACGGGENPPEPSSSGAEEPMAVGEAPPATNAAASTALSRPPPGPAELAYAVAELIELARKADVSLAIERAAAYAQDECNGYCPEPTPSPLESGDPLEPSDRDPILLAELLGELRDAARQAGEREPFVAIATTAQSLAATLDDREDELSTDAIASITGGALSAVGAAFDHDSAPGDPYLCWAALPFGWDLLMGWSLESQMEIHEAEQRLETEQAMASMEGTGEYPDTSNVDDMWAIVNETGEAMGALIGAMNEGPAKASEAIDAQLPSTAPLDDLIQRDSGVAFLRRIQVVCRGVDG